MSRSAAYPLTSAALLALVLAPPAAAQPLLGPSKHFGAYTMPYPQERAYLGFSLDSFTQFDKLGNVYNAIDETIGLNFLNYSWSVQSSRWPSLYYRSSLQMGYGHDTPARRLQDKLHILMDSATVPRGDTRDEVADWVVDFEADYWGRLATGYQRFAGGGFYVGSTSSLVYAHAGFNQPRWVPGASPFATFGGLVRLGRPFPGDAFPGEGVSTWYLAMEVSARFPFGAWLRTRCASCFCRLAPDVTLTGHIDNGFFEGSNGQRLGEKLGSVVLSWADELVVLELWNDYFGGEFKDHGPTYGFQLYSRFPPNVRWPLTWLP